MKFIFLLCFLFFVTNSFCQYQFKGQLAKNVNGKTVYLSVIEDYRKLSRISFDQIIKKTTVDSLGFFRFEGNNLPNTNRIYRIHIDECDANSQNSNHFFGRCENSKSILFIANNKDHITFPTSFADEVLCEISSTNKNSEAFLKIDILKEEMAFDFTNIHSEASKKMNSKKWFATFQQFGKSLNEPLAELYIYDFLSNKRNETYTYYLKDFIRNNYYTNLLSRLEKKYPNEEFTKLYRTEIAADAIITSPHNLNNKKQFWILGSLLAFSVLLNFFFIWKRKAFKEKQKHGLHEKLTTQEQKVVDQILMGRTNKEIAANLFISLSTVKTHINNLYKKLNVSSREEIKQLLD